MLVTSIASFGLSSWLQREISQPIGILPRRLRGQVAREETMTLARGPADRGTSSAEFPDTSRNAVGDRAPRRGARVRHQDHRRTRYRSVRAELLADHADLVEGEGKKRKRQVAPEHSFSPT